MSPNRDDYSKRIGGAVRAEMSRAGRPVADLTRIIGRSRTTVYALVAGRQAFDYVELQQIADDLGIDLMQIIRSAELGEVAA